MTTTRPSISRFRRGSEKAVRLGLLWLTLTAAPAFAQLQTSQGSVPRASFVTVDQDRLFLESQYGQRVQGDLDRARTELAAENRRIEQDLIAEELDLTERRATLTSSDFAVLAREFDTRVDKIRAEQDSKSTALQQRLEQERKAFLAKLGPVLADLMTRVGASALIDRNAILLATDEIDITDEAIAAMNEAIGAGESLAAEPSDLPAPKQSDTPSSEAPPPPETAQ